MRHGASGKRQRSGFSANGRHGSNARQRSETANVNENTGGACDDKNAWMINDDIKS